MLLISSCARPIAQFATTETQYKAPATVHFTNTSAKANTYTWDFGDGMTTTEVNPSHTYLHSGNYNVKLTAGDGKKSVIKTNMIHVAPPSKCLVYLKTDFGNMLIELYDATPLHRDNFLKLVESGFYNDLLFHRVINGFMIQGGDPNSRKPAAGQSLGSGGPGYTIPAEFVDTLYHLKGALAAARMGDVQNPEKKSSGSQFYIVQGGPVDVSTLHSQEAQKGFNYPSSVIEEYKTIGGTPHLDHEYTVFGRVIEGMDVIDKIAAQPTGAGNRPVKDIKMKITAIK